MSLRDRIKKDDKVKCVDAYFVDDPELPFFAGEIRLPKKGKIYTVRDIVDTGYGIGVRLAEIKNRKFYFDNIKKHQELVFAIERFKRV